MSNLNALYLPINLPLPLKAVLLLAPLLQRQLDRFPVSSVTLINDVGQNIGLFIKLVCNGDVNADRNGANEALTFLGDFIPGGRQSSIVKVSFIGNLMVSFFL